MTLYVLVGALCASIVLRVWLGDRMLDLSAFTVLFAPVNRVRFSLRRALGFSRGEPMLTGEPKENLFGHLPVGERKKAEARADALRSRYPTISGAWEKMTRVSARENLYVLGILDDHAATRMHPRDEAHVVDVGSKDFVYAPALAAFVAPYSAREARVTGVEIDGYVVYKDLRSRADYARAWARLAGSGVSYRVADFLAYEPDEPVSLLTIFYPFVTRFALLRWGLPKSEYRPEALLAHAAAMLDVDGVLVIVNHTHEEREILRGLMREIKGVKLASGAVVTSNLVDYFEDVPERSVSVYVRT